MPSVQLKTGADRLKASAILNLPAPIASRANRPLIGSFDGRLPMVNEQ